MIEAFSRFSHPINGESWKDADTSSKNNVSVETVSPYIEFYLVIIFENVNFADFRFGQYAKHPDGIKFDLMSAEDSRTQSENILNALNDLDASCVLRVLIPSPEKTFSPISSNIFPERSTSMIPEHPEND